MRLEMQEVAGGKWRFWLIAFNGNEMARSNLYGTKRACMRAGKTLLRAIRFTTVDVSVENETVELW